MVGRKGDPGLGRGGIQKFCVVGEGRRAHRAPAWGRWRNMGQSLWHERGVSSCRESVKQRGWEGGTWGGGEWRAAGSPQCVQWVQPTEASKCESAKFIVLCMSKMTFITVPKNFKNADYFFPLQINSLAMVFWRELQSQNISYVSGSWPKQIICQHLLYVHVAFRGGVLGRDQEWCLYA